MLEQKQDKYHKNIYDAIVNYITNKSTFESYDAINGVLKKIELANSIEEIFRIPIEERLFNFINSLQWLYFMCFIINIIKDKNIIMPCTFNINFSTDNAIIYLSNKYNAANETFYNDYFDNLDNEIDK